MALTNEPALTGLHEEKIMKRLINSVRQSALARKVMVGAATSLYLGLAIVPAAQASDTEVYARKVAVDTELAPTLMMMLDTSGSMDYCLDGANSGCTAANPMRLTAMRNALQKILFGSAADNVKAVPGFVRMGYSRYNTDANKGGWVKYPARPLDAFVDINPDGEVGSAVTASSADAEQVSGTLTLVSPELDLGLGSVGMHFSRLNVPKGATINEAYIEFTANRDSSALPALWEISVQDIDTAPMFAAGANDIDSRTYSPVIATESVIDTWVQDQVYEVNVAEALKYLVNKSDWCGGNDAVLRLMRVSGSAEDRYAYSYDANPAKAPRLVVNYTIDPKATDSCIVAPFLATAQVTDGRNDIEWAEGDTGNKAVRNSSALEFAFVSASKRNHVAMRFTGFTGNSINKDAIIDEATITAVGYQNRTGVPVLQVAAFDSDNLPAFSCLTATTCAVPTTGYAGNQTWSLPGNRVYAGAAHSVPVTSQVQYLVNRAGWAPGNAMGFMMRSNVTASSNNGAFLSFEGASTSSRPYLTVKGRQRFTDLSKLKTVRDEIWEELAALNVEGGTPLGAAYVETMRYMLGQPVFAPLVDPRTTTDATMTTYKSPVKASSQCAGNYVFALTDGEPNNLAQVGTNTKEVTGATCPASYGTYVYGSSMQENWRCMLAAAEWGLKPTNQINTRIRTNTVLFGDDDANTVGNMRQVAKFGGGTFYKAGDEKALVDALTDTINSLLDVSGTITAPGVAVNQLNRLNNLDQLFYAVFDPDVQKAFWPGNVKRYRLDIAAEDVFDVNGAQAVDSATSFFKSTAQSWWSPGVDGDKARLGGAASVLPDPATRKMFTYTGSLPSSGASLTAVDLGNTGFVSAGKALTGITDNNIFANLVNWYKGYQIASLTDGLVAVDSTSLRRQEIGGALHSRPVLVNYGFSGTAEAAALDPDLQDNVLIFSTLEGTLHAVDAKTGEEHFSFIPGEKLALLPKLFANPVQENPEFGMDLTWSVLRKDANNDGTPEKIYVYGGMRMGGNNYYALDVTNRNAPSLLFAIEGGSGDFSNLGQTWSQPVVSAMRINGVVKRVLVFGGGYDPQHETENTVFSSDGMGSSIYIVDAETGKLIQSVDSSDNGDMKFAIPSQPKTLDVNSDGLVDHIYAGDMAGQVFRIDLDNRLSASSLVVRVKTVARVGQTDSGGGSVSTQRRFFEPPTVALFKDSTNKIFAAVAMGSGYRSHPLNEATTDHFFTFFDYDVPRPDILTTTKLQDTIGMSDLAEVKPDATVTVDIAGKKGWYLAFPDTGEKVITSGLIFQNTLIFSSYVPSVEGGDVCSPVIGRTKLYRASLADGLPTGFTVKDNSVFGLGGDPQLVILEGDKDATCDKNGDGDCDDDGEKEDCDKNGDGVCDEKDNIDPNEDEGKCSDIAIVTGTDVEEFEGCVRASLKRTRWTEKFRQK